MTDVNYTAWKFWFDVLQLAGTLAIGIYVWWSNRDKLTAAKFSELEAKVNTRLLATDHDQVEIRRDQSCREHKARTLELENTVSRVGHELRSMPTRQDLHDLTSELTHMTNKMGRLEGRLEGLNRVADLINEFLINQGAKR